MSFISYAQNLEDVMLNRALGEQVSGFYVDVGANHPVLDSITKHFYDKGWSGVNFEPEPQYYSMVSEARVRDVNINAACGAEEGEIEFYTIPETGLSTAAPEGRDWLIEEGYEVEVTRVRCVTLSNELERLNVTKIDFMSVDVEGFEEEVLLGMDFSRHRPKIILCECMKPMTQEPTGKKVEELVTSSGYSLIYEDGLNNFFLANECSELAKHFRFPPNVFDAYERHKTIESENSARRLNEQVQSLTARLQDSNSRLESALSELQQMHDMSFRQIASFAKAKLLRRFGG